MVHLNVMPMGMCAKQTDFSVEALEDKNEESWAGEMAQPLEARLTTKNIVKPAI